jgi:hypothetical protein
MSINSFYLKTEVIAKDEYRIKEKLNIINKPVHAGKLQQDSKVNTNYTQFSRSTVT